MKQEFAKKCGSAATREGLSQLVSKRQPLEFGVRDVTAVNRAASRLGLGSEVRIAYAGTHTFEPLPAYVRAHAVGIGFGVANLTAPFNQYMQQLLQPESELLKFAPHVLFLSCSLRELAPRVHNEFAFLSEEEIASERNRVLDQLQEAAELASSRTDALVLVGNCPRPAWPVLGIADAKRDPSEMEFYASLNLELARRFRQSDRVHVFDLDRLVGGTRRATPGIERIYFLAKVPWAESSMNAIAEEILRYVVAARGAMRKCLVVDLDNTLWGGVVGEDGAEGVSVGTGSAMAEAYLSFQHEVRSLRQRGVLLAICSKNNPEDVIELFARRTDMPLRMSDFAVAEIGWEDKATGVRRIAEALNIGADSLVVVDDNAAERAVIANAVTGVTVLELPRDPAGMAGSLRRQVLFEKLRINTEDLVRVRQYEKPQRRERLEAHGGDLQRYLADLGTEIVVRRARDMDIPRVHELFNKTNQFNLTTRRYSLADVQRFVRETGYSLRVVSARDTFGDLGTIGVYLVDARKGAARIDSFLISCRALGRGIETAVMNCIKSEVAARAHPKLLAEFVPTGKNKPAQSFLVDQRFQLIDRAENGMEYYEATDAGLQPLPCDHVKISSE